MTEKEINELTKEWEALLTTFYIQGYRIFNKALIESIKPVLNAIEQSGSTVFASQLSNQLVTSIPIATAMEQFINKISDRTARHLFRQYLKFLPKETNIGVGFGNMQFRMAMQEYIRVSGSQHVQSITETTRKLVNKAFLDSAEAGETQKQLAKRMLRYVNGGLDSNINKRARALMIARTETLMATARAKEAQMDLYPDVEFEKVWIHDHPKVPRENHVALNKKRVDRDKPFITNGVSLMYAGDRNAPPSEIINCRCSTVYVPKVDSEGNIIRS